LEKEVDTSGMIVYNDTKRRGLPDMRICKRMPRRRSSLSRASYMYDMYDVLLS